ncbi:SAM-dependent methyltransferase [Streptomyces inusitatus]|uniref:SAM-dependent methyltransferase n=1 Tax=Streptomyces inusitatus TaxID=68221 RepID=A0A918QJL6_9ACTN|nr:class I SAM-dependent methyltransferase [Streptomyces inusitatus]GGZ50222.1 SAM-dependent methyltransferase [Streptomyces inusitatus]
MGTDVGAQARALAALHPEIHASLDMDRVEEQRRRAARPSAHTDDFGDSGSGGRGESYVVAQRSTATRARGISQLVDIVTGNSAAESRVLVDLLGGDGLVSRVVAREGREDVVIATCDASPFMVEQAWAQGIPALRQRAESMLFRDASVGGVLLAYGSHHIPPTERSTVAEEAFRVLEPGGVFVLHDFLVGSPVESWFKKVVDVYATTGHDYPHFAWDEADRILRSAGFEKVFLTLMDDSFLVSGPTRQHAERELGRYLADMYGLEKLYCEFGADEAHRRTFEMARAVFRFEDAAGVFREARAAFDEDSATWSVTMPREALVAFGRKPLCPS